MDQSPIQATFPGVSSNDMIASTLHHRQALLGFEGILTHSSPKSHEVIEAILEICNTTLDLSDDISALDPPLAFDAAQITRRVLRLVGRHIQARDNPRFNVVDIRRHDLVIPPVPTDAVAVL